MPLSLEVPIILTTINNCSVFTVPSKPKTNSGFDKQHTTKANQKTATTKSNATESLNLNNILDRDGIVLDRINQGRLSSPRSHLFILVSGATAIDF